MEVAEQAGRGESSADDVDAQRAVAGPDGGVGPRLGAQQFAGVRQERPPVDGRFGPARGPREEPYAYGPLQRGDPLGDGLLGDRQLHGGVLETARVHDGHEGAHSVEIHVGDDTGAH